MGNVRRAIRPCIAKRPVSEKKNVVNTIGSATIERITWLAKWKGTACARIRGLEKSCPRALRGSQCS
jgi:hypothetical protein